MRQLVAPLSINAKVVVCPMRNLVNGCKNDAVLLHRTPPVCSHCWGGSVLCIIAVGGYSGCSACAVC